MTELAAGPVEAVRAPVLAGVVHGFLGRTGGVSRGDVAGLNVGLGSGDEPALIAENRRRALAAVAPGQTLVTVYQVHSADCVIARSAWADDERPHADAIVTDRPGLALGILTADCAPVLFADVRAGVVAAAHAGWKGAIAGVAEATIAAMETLGASRADIRAAVGPCIAQPSYEVDAPFRERFLAQAEGNTAFFAAGAPGRWQFDLAGYVVAQLRRAGIEAEATGQDTYAQPDRYFSYRRACHRSEAAYGRQISLISLG